MQDLSTLFFKDEIKGVNHDFLKELNGKITFEEKERLRSSKNRIVKLKRERGFSFIGKVIGGFLTAVTVINSIAFANPSFLFYSMGFALLFLLARKVEKMIRKVESEKAMGEMGITPETATFVWLGYYDGMLEYVPPLELTEKICRLIRLYRPDAVISMDPGTNWMKWHKTDHRSSAFITLDAARAAAYHLYFPKHRINEGLQPFTVTDYFFYSTGESNYKVDITSVSDKKIRARAWYVSQYGAGNLKYVGPEPDQEKLNNQLKNNTERREKGEKIYENFRRLQESMSF